MTLDQFDAAAAAEPTQLTLPLERQAPRAAQGRRCMEADFPMLEISRLAQLESYRKNIYRPAYYIKWWTRRLGSGSTTVGPVASATA